MDSNCPFRGQIILLGKRKGAVAAAKRCGWEPVVIDVRARREQAQAAFGGTATWAVEQAGAIFPNERSTAPLGVAAVTTGSVVAAAAIRAHFDLPGISQDVAWRCHDKLVMKKAIAAAGIPCAPWLEVTTKTTVEELADVLGFPLVLKMPISSGGRGVWICNNPAEVAKNLRPGLLAEGFVYGKEMSVETIRVAGKTVFRNFTHYLKPRWANIVPAVLDADDAMDVNQLVKKVHKVLGISSGISHMEIFLGEHGPVFGEIAARPPGGYLMELLKRTYEFDPWEALLRIAVGETPQIKQEPTCYSGVWLIHPGMGKVIGVEGLDAARAIPGVVHVSCRLKAGDIVTDRVGSGDATGRIVAEASTSRTCADTLKKAVDTVQVPLES